MAVDMGGPLGWPFDYGIAGSSWDLHAMPSPHHHPHPPPPHHYGLDGHGHDDYDDMGLLSHLVSPFSAYSIKRCQGFIRCDMDIDAEVVGWVIGKNGSTIKDLKSKTGCNMWVDQRALKLTITGPDVRTVEHAAKSVEAYVAAAPIKAGAVEAAVTRSLECPPHLLDILGDRATIARIVKETRAQVVVNKKMMRVIIRGGPHAVQMACSRVQSIIAAAAAEHSRRALLPPPAPCPPAAGGGPHSDYGLSDAESTDSHGHGHSGGSRGSVGGRLSRTGSGVGSARGDSAPGSPRSATWSLFSGRAAFAAVKGGKEARSGGERSHGAHGDGGMAPLHGGSSPSRSHSRRATAAAAAGGEDVAGLAGLLAALKLTKYAPAFEENEVDLDALQLMSEADFTELGIPKGPRLKIMNAARVLGGGAAADAPPAGGAGAPHGHKD